MSDAPPTVGSTRRRRLPNRRSTVTESIQFAAGNGRVVQYEASVGFDELGRPKEIFLFGAKDGADIAAVLTDTAVALSGRAATRRLGPINGCIDRPHPACGRSVAGGYASLGNWRRARPFGQP